MLMTDAVEKVAVLIGVCLGLPWRGDYEPVLAVVVA
jgi:hypothetical protein